MDDPELKFLAVIVLTAGLAGAVWLFWDEIRPPADTPVITQPAPVVVEEPARIGPIHPIAENDAESYDGALVTLPPLTDSDSYFLLELLHIFGPEIGNMLVNEELIDKFVASVDNLPRNHLAERIRPVGRLTGAFDAVDGSSNDQFYLNVNNYARYDLLVRLVTTADLEEVADMYRRYYPLLQESYEQLGYPNAYFNDRAVEVIDHLLATPEPAEPIRLVRPHVLFEFADAKLEALSSGQKLLIRAGGEHSAKIKHVLRRLRALIAQAPGG